VPLDSNFPSDGHRQKLKTKASSSTLDTEDLWYWHAYEYGWRRVMIGGDDLPVDPEKRWFNAELAAAAEVFFCRKFNKRPPRTQEAAE
jgi:hypothetical protein